MQLMPGAFEYRSALTDYPGPFAPDEPTVTAIIPVYNEVNNIENIWSDLLAQDYPKLNKIYFVDGLSDDGTAQALQRLEGLDDRVELLTNPKRLPAAGINLALAQAKSDIVMRLDAHARYRNDVVRRSVEALIATGAGGVGAVARPARAHTLIGRAIVAAHKSKFGVGAAKFRQEHAEGWADTVWNGCYWLHVVKLVGPLREDLERAEDNDFNQRVRGLGYGLYLSPNIVAYYQPRETLQALWRQYFSNGLATIMALPQNPQAFSIRHILPLAFVLSLIVPVIGAMLWPSMLFVSISAGTLYLATILLATVVSAKHEVGPHLALLPLALMTLHLSHGFGALWGVTTYAWRRYAADEPALTRQSPPGQ